MVSSGVDARLASSLSPRDKSWKATSEIVLFEKGEASRKSLFLQTLQKVLDFDIPEPGKEKDFPSPPLCGSSTYESKDGKGGSGQRSPN